MQKSGYLELKTVYNFFVFIGNKYITVKGIIGWILLDGRSIVKYSFHMITWFYKS